MPRVFAILPRATGSRSGNGHVSCGITPIVDGRFEYDLGKTSSQRRRERIRRNHARKCQLARIAIVEQLVARAQGP
eukprot:5125486-Pyramimonas_sp.AAC.1